jgi:hypothetical protein
MSDDLPQKEERLRDLEQAKSQNSGPSGCFSLLLVLVGLFLLLVPGGCALFGLLVGLKSLTHDPNALTFSIAFVLFNAALAYGGYRLIRDALDR